MLQQCAIDAGFVSHLRGDSVPKLGLGGPGILSSAPHGAQVYQYDRLEPLTLPFLAMSPEEFEHRINSLNEDNPGHYESAKNKILSKLECLSSGTFHPYGLAHVWIGPPGALLIKLIFGDRRCPPLHRLPSSMRYYRQTCGAKLRCIVFHCQRLSLIHI